MSEDLGGMSTGRSNRSTEPLVSQRQQSRDAIVRIIKHQLDQYLSEANGEYDLNKINYNYHFGQNIAGKDMLFIESLFKVNDDDSINDDGEMKRVGLDLEIRRIYKKEYDLNKLV